MYNIVIALKCPESIQLKVGIYVIKQITMQISLAIALVQIIQMKMNDFTNSCIIEPMRFFMIGIGGKNIFIFYQFRKY